MNRQDFIVTPDSPIISHQITVRAMLIYVAKQHIQISQFVPVISGLAEALAL
jgi:hypothetical protein